jgi:perosamine synthetase
MASSPQLASHRAVLQHGRQWIDEDDIAAVVEVLRSDGLNAGPAVGELESAFARVCGTRGAVAVSSGTAALHLAMLALGIGPGDEVIVPTLTFAATANCVAYCGGTPVFADVNPETLLIDPDSAARLVTSRTQAVIAVDYAGQPCDYGALRALTDEHGLALVADACHALGAREGGAPVGSLADISCFSLHPVTHVTTGEGGVLTTDDGELAASARRLRNHGIDPDQRARTQAGSWSHEQVELGFNYRLTDLQCALGSSQLRKLGPRVTRRREIAARYDHAFASRTSVLPVAVRPGVSHAYGLYVVQVPERERVFTALRAAGIGADVHYVPVHLQPYYREQHSTGPGLCPVAEAAYERLLSLPVFPQMTNEDVDHVVETTLGVS